MSKKLNLPKNKIVDLYVNNKLSSKKIAEIFKCASRTVLLRLHDWKTNLRQKGPPRVKFTEDELRKLYLEKRLSSWKIAKLLGHSRSTIHRKLKKLGINRDLAEAHIRYKRRPFSGDLSEKSYLIGFAIGDLRVRKIWAKSKTIKVDCGSTKKEQIKLFRELFEKYGRVWTSKPNDGKIQMESLLDLSFSFLLNPTKELNWIFADKQYFLPFLAGFIDAEGSFYISKNQAILSIGNYNKNLLSLVHEKLNELDVNSKVYEDNSKGYVSSDGYVRKQNYISLYVRRKNDLLKIIKLLEIYLRHDNRIKQLKIAKENILIRNRLYGDRSS